MIFVPRWHESLRLDDALVMQEIELAQVGSCRGGKTCEKEESAAFWLDDRSIHTNMEGKITALFLSGYGRYINRFDLNLLKNLRGLKTLYLGNVTPKELDILYTLKGLESVVLCIDKEQIDSTKAARMEMRYGMHGRGKYFAGAWTPLEDYPYE